MEITFWGVRGSSPVNGPEFIKVGGHTSCVSVYTDTKDLYIFDGGSGLLNLGTWIQEIGLTKAKLFFTHLHLDHIMGLPFFGPIWTPEFQLDLYSTHFDLKDFLSKHLFHHPIFPVEFHQLQSIIHQRPVVPGEFLHFGEDKISMIALNHPGGSIGYRLDTPNGSVAYMTDTECEGDIIDPVQKEFVKGIDLMIYDATFCPHEYEEKRGWGHSTHIQAAKLAKAADVKQLALFHHDPAHTDTIVEKAVLEAQAIFPNTIAATQGLKIRVKK